MTFNYRSSASKDIRTFLWDLLTQNGFLDENDYIADGFDSPLVPIIPAQQIPEFNNLLPGKPYIYYEYEVMPYQENWWITEEMITLHVVSQDHDLIEEIQNYLNNVFRRYDDSALSVNRYYLETNAHKFHYFRIERIDSPKPFENEGGFLLGEMQIHYAYSRLTNTDGLF